MSQYEFRTRASCLAKQYSKFEVYEKKVKFSAKLHEVIGKKTLSVQKELLNLLML